MQAGELQNSTIICTCMRPGRLLDILLHDRLTNDLFEDPRKQVVGLCLSVRLLQSVGYEQLASGAAMFPEPVLSQWHALYAP